jgi:excisionase family DNA binding protein
MVLDVGPLHRSPEVNWNNLGGMDPHPTSPRAELDLMTEQDLARHLKVCRRQLYNWRIAGLIPYFKLGKAVRFRVADVAAAIERMRIG